MFFSSQGLPKSTCECSWVRGQIKAVDSCFLQNHKTEEQNPESGAPAGYQPMERQLSGAENAPEHG